MIVESNIGNYILNCVLNCLYDLKYHDGLDDLVIDRFTIGDPKEDTIIVDVYFKGSISENDLSLKLLSIFLNEEYDDEYRFICHKL